MIKRKITSNGLLNISGQVRGAALNGKIVLELYADEAGILISPYDAGKKYNPTTSYQCRFSPYNRIAIPERLRALSKIESNVEIQVRGDGTLLLRPNSVDVCAICGSLETLRDFSPSKKLCLNCIEAITKYEKKEGRVSEEL